MLRCDPTGLDLSLLDSSKRALLLETTGRTEDDYVHDAVDAQPLPLKTDQEIERELEHAEKELDMPSEKTVSNVQKATEGQEAPKKPQKRSRADMLKDLQAKLAAASSGAPSSVPITSLDKYTDSSTPKGKEATPAVPKGFKPVAEKPRKKRKKDVASDTSIVDKVHPELLSQGPPAGTNAVIDIDAADKKLELGTADAVIEGVEEEVDIFADAGEYEDEFADNANANGDDAAAGPSKYFDDQDDLIPTFQTYRSPSPEPASKRKARSPSPAQQANPYSALSPNSKQKQPQPQRLEGFSDTTTSAKEMLAYDDWQIKEEKRKLKKLKGKDKKEALEREKYYSGEKEAGKEKDRLNREVMEYEKYERKKQKS